MAETRRERLKQSLLLGFIALNLVLVLLIWVDILIEEPGNQGFVRSTTAPAATSGVLITEAPNSTPSQPDIRHKHGTPTTTPTPYEDAGDVGMHPPSQHSFPEGS